MIILGSQPVYSINDSTLVLSFDTYMDIVKTHHPVSKQAGIEVKTNMVLNMWNATIEQINLYNQTVKDYFGLLDGERKMFIAGESS